MICSDFVLVVSRIKDDEFGGSKCLKTLIGVQFINNFVSVSVVL